MGSATQQAANQKARGKYHPKSGSWSRITSAGEVSVRLLRAGLGRL
jgi:hypothetical protein